MKLNHLKYLVDTFLPCDHIIQGKKTILKDKISLEINKTSYQGRFGFAFIIVPLIAVNIIPVISVFYNN